MRALTLVVLLALPAAAEGGSEALKAQLAVLRAQIPQLKVSTDAPQLGKQLTAFKAALQAFAAEFPDKKADVAALTSQLQSLESQAQQARRNDVLGGNGSIDMPSLNPKDYEKQAGAEFCKKAAAALEPVVAKAEEILKADPRSQKGDRDKAAGPERRPEEEPAPEGGRFQRMAKVVNGLTETIAEKGPRFDGTMRDAVASPPDPAAVRKDLTTVLRQTGDRRITHGEVRAEQTEASLRRFQKRFKLPETGQLDDATRAALEKEARAARERSQLYPQRGDHDRKVGALQQTLRRLGARIAQDDMFGPQTMAAVRAFQKASKLAVTGQVDPQTWEKLVAAAGSRTRAAADRMAPEQRQPGDTPAGFQPGGRRTPLDDVGDFFKEGLERTGEAIGGLLRAPLEFFSRISSPFGPRAAPKRGASTFHPGVDYAAPSGTPVQAAGVGVVTQAGPYGGYGNAIIVDHGNGTRTLYGHLSRVRVRPGQKVTQGMLIGNVGATGVATGPHLHYEVLKNGRHVDPLKHAHD